MVEFETWAASARPDYVVVVGDVNSTLAASLVAAKNRIRLGHVESGLRSFDRDMPEEVNRLVADALADDLFTSCADAAPDLLREGVDPNRIHFVGNVMIDSLVRHREKAAASSVLETLGVPSRVYTVVTLHRPSNVDDPQVLRGILGALGRLSEENPCSSPSIREPGSVSRSSGSGAPGRAPGPAAHGLLAPDFKPDDAASP
jgi:UDP-N-acetylglucosamine 2-epimerase (non-hydrolysing)